MLATSQMVINQPKKKILVVCAANYCRSPVAEELLKLNLKISMKYLLREPI